MLYFVKTKDVESSSIDFHVVSAPDCAAVLKRFPMLFVVSVSPITPFHINRYFGGVATLCNNF